MRYLSPSSIIPACCNFSGTDNVGQSVGPSVHLAVSTDRSEKLLGCYFHLNWMGVHLLQAFFATTQTQYLQMSLPFVRRSYRMLDAWNSLTVLCDRTVCMDLKQRTPLYIMPAYCCLFLSRGVGLCIALYTSTAAFVGCSEGHGDLKLYVFEI